MQTYEAKQFASGILIDRDHGKSPRFSNPNMWGSTDRSNQSMVNGVMRACNMHGGLSDWRPQGKGRKANVCTELFRVYYDADQGCQSTPLIMVTFKPGPQEGIERISPELHAVQRHESCPCLYMLLLLSALLPTEQYASDS
jgi:hypothetical protein